jgi:hypothetical protein
VRAPLQRCLLQTINMPAANNQPTAMPALHPPEGPVAVRVPLQRCLLPVAHHGCIECLNSSSTTRQLQQRQQQQQQQGPAATKSTYVQC